MEGLLAAGGEELLIYLAEQVAKQLYNVDWNKQLNGEASTTIAPRAGSKNVFPIDTKPDNEPKKSVNNQNVAPLMPLYDFLKKPKVEGFIKDNFLNKPANFDILKYAERYKNISDFPSSRPVGNAALPSSWGGFPKHYKY